ncbi:MAG: hypothetical protein HYR96_07470 [Deltaproteobacteria bacterium]|nr:hypothetical protein [Deltaproteobacteria bacterium]MBI3296296.1 hypothetical protein [Deltaproteobacteria bacterium]
MEQVVRVHPFLNLLKFLGALASCLAIFQGLMLYSTLGDDHVGRDSLILLMLLQLLPFFVGLVRMHVTFLAFVLLNHCFTYSFSKYNSIFNVMGLHQVPFDSKMAINELISCTALIIVGYVVINAFAWLRVQAGRRRNMITISLPNKQLAIIGIIVLTSSILTGHLPGAFHQIHDLAYVMCLVLMLSSEASQSKKFHTALIIGALLNMSHTLVQYGSLVDFGHFAVILFVRSCLAKNVRGVAGVVFVVIIGLFIQPIKGLYRVQSRAGDFSVLEKAGILGDLVEWRYFTEEGWASQKKLGPDRIPIALSENGEAEDEMEYVGEDEGGAFSALSMGFTRVHDDSFERTLVMTPSRVPYWGGETYTNMLYMFIPRFLWPDKPSWKHWHKFGKVYGYLAPNDDQTSVSFSMFAEAYMNYGFEGLYIISFVFGMILAIAERTAFAIFGGAYIFAYISLLTPMMNYSADLGIMVNREVIVITALLIFRPFLLRNIIGDDYSR